MFFSFNYCEIKLKNVQSLKKYSQNIYTREGRVACHINWSKSSSKEIIIMCISNRNKIKKKVSRDCCACCQHNNHSDSIFWSIKYLCIFSQRYWNLVQKCSVRILAANSDLSFLFSLAQRAVATKTLVLQQKPRQPRAHPSYSPFVISWQGYIQFTPYCRKNRYAAGSTKMV